MIAVSISVEGIAGLTWASWKRLVSVIPQLGFAGIFCSDHFVPPAPAYPDSLEMMMALGYLADHTSGVHFGSLVSPLSFRDPVMLARQAIALDGLSDGRMILGLGAGWNEREHTMFGYPLGDVATRFARFADGLAVITRLLEHNQPVSYAGRFFQLQDAMLRPRPARAGGLPVLIGGNGPRRTLPLAARYAAIWNAVGLPPDAFREHSRLLDDLLRREGRQPEAVRRTVTITALCGRTPQELEQRVAWFRKGAPEVAVLPLEAVLNIFRDMVQAIVVTPEELIRTMDDYAAAGADEIMLQWFGADDIEGLELLAEHVLPHVRSSSK
jgi:alkanesulfonate monooxygenase SsuD/methylene tetrahydromethanopterin reductase-like flavin-dependent oxidoreductase (luciferase family)